jgi:hypothetical protein
VRRPLTAAENNRRGNALSALLVALVLVLVAVVYFGYHPEHAGAATRPPAAQVAPPIARTASTYNHAPACRASLTGHGSDDDAGWFTSATHSSGFLGFQMRLNGSFVAWRGANGSVWVRGVFGQFGGGFRFVRGHCWRGDYGPDRFVG